MARPCQLKHPAPAPGCAICDAYLARPDLRALWDGDRARVWGAGGDTLRGSRFRLDCVHKGPVARTLAGGCGACRVYGCAVKGECLTVPHRLGPGLPDCQACDRYRPRPPAPEAPGLLVTGGIGDLFAVEARIPPAGRAALEQAHYAAPAAAELRELMAALPNYPRLRLHRVLPTGRRTHYSRRTVERRHGKLPPGVEDYSIGARFPMNLPLVGSSFLAHRVAAPELPPVPYVVLVPHSTWGQWADRNFNPADWAACLAFLDARGLYGVVLCRERLPLPAHPRLLDWQGRTSILESVEVLKGAEGYLGIDSCLSVLAAGRFPATRLAVKGHGAWLLANLPNYYAPHTAFPFVTRHLTPPAWE